MIRLPNTGTYSLELITAQNGAQSVVSYSDATSSAYTGGTQVASITSATTTTICSTPAASTVRDVDQINIKNTYAGSHTVTVQVDANGTNYPLIVAALLTDESLNYTHGSGWQVKDANGNTKNSALSAMTSAQLAAILTDETGSGAAVFANGPTLIAPILGTPASGTVTNLTGTASININGTVGATTPAAGTFTTLTSTGNATLGDAEATDTHAIKGATTLLANSASAALTITQTGAGNAFVVEDSASTDSTPFVIDANGNVLAGYTARFDISPTGGGTYPLVGCFVTSGQPFATGTFSNDALGSGAVFLKSRGSTVGSNTVLISGDTLGIVVFRGADGTNYLNGASIIASVDGTPGTNDMPGRLTFNTTADGASSTTERMRISQDGTTTLGGLSTAPALKVSPIGTPANYFTIQAQSTGQTPYIYAEGTDTNVNFGIYTKGSGDFIFASAGSAAIQARIIHTASANHYITLTGDNGGNPKIGASAGTIALISGALATSSTLGLGYGTGAGGTVTQITSKATSVTLNTPCGRITMNNAALAASTTVGFSVNNSVFSDQDVVHLMIASGATSYSYNIWATRNSSGVFNIYVRNISGGSLSEAVELQFVIIKGATS